MALSESQIMNTDVAGTVSVDGRGDAMRLTQIRNDKGRKSRLSAMFLRPLRKDCGLEAGRLYKLFARYRERIEEHLVPFPQGGGEASTADSMAVTESWARVDNKTDVGRSRRRFHASSLPTFAMPPESASPRIRERRIPKPS